jgi:hypothetical protein
MTMKESLPNDAGRPNRFAPLRRLKPYLLALGFYLLLAVILTYPLLLHITTHVPGDGRDDPPLVWNLWWVRYALLNLHTNPLNCSFMFYPIGVNLTFFTLTLLNGFLSIPLQMTGGLVLASNVELLLSYAIAGLAMFLLALEALPARARRDRSLYFVAAFVAGLVYAFAPIKMIFASLGQFNMTSTQWLPLCVLYVLRATRMRSGGMGAGHDARWSEAGAARPTGRVRRLAASFFPRSDRRGQRDALLAALFLLLTAYAEFTFASFLVIFIAVYVLYLLVTQRNSLLTRHMLGRATLLGLPFVAGLWPILSSMLHEMAVEGDYSLAAGWGFADIFVADLLGFVTPSHLHPIFGAWAQEVTRSFSYANFATVGFVVSFLAVVGIVARQRVGLTGRAAAPVTFWGLSALLYAILSLGPVLHIAGRWVFDLDGLLVRVPLPFIILHYIPFIKANRYPSRLQVLVILCLAVLVAYGVSAILNRTQTNADKTQKDAAESGGSLSVRQRSVRVHQRSIVTVVLVAAILFEYLAVPLPLSDMRTPQVYQTIAQDNANAPLLDLPISWRNSFQFIPQSFTALPANVNTVVMFEQFYQATHEGPIVSGNTSRNPEFKFTYFLQAPILRTLIALEEGRPVSAEQIAYDRSIMPEALRFLGFKYIVLHPPLVGGPVEEYVRAVFPVEPIPADPGLSAYRIIAPPPVDRLTIDMASDLSNLYRADGWGEPQSVMGRPARWSDRQRSRLMLPLAGDGPVRLVVEHVDGSFGRPVEFLLNNHVIYSRDSGPLEQPVTIDVPAGIAHAGINDLVVSYGTLMPLGTTTSTSTAVGQTGVKTSQNIVVHSAGLDGGGDLGFAHVYVNGKDAISGRRGLNVAVINPASGVVESHALFDVLTDPAADGRFLGFVKAVPDGRIVAVAVMDDASTNFGEGGLAALRMIGAQADLRGRFRNSYAAIGVKGATPGQALEQWAQGKPASVAVGAHIFGRGLGIAVSSVTVEQK